MKRYRVTLNGLSPILMHGDNLVFAEKIKAWQNAPDNKALSVRADDRSPAWTWIGYTYHDRKHFGIPADNLMTMLREGGAKIPFKGKETYKKQTQSGILIDDTQWDLYREDGSKYAISTVEKLIGNNDFFEHLEAVEKLGFELLVKRAAVNRAKHVRVRPLFRDWTAIGTLTVLDEELSGITEDTLLKILQFGGALCGLCDWRPSSPSAGGSFGKFSPRIEVID